MFAFKKCADVSLWQLFILRNARRFRQTAQSVRRYLFSRTFCALLFSVRPSLTTRALRPSQCRRTSGQVGGISIRDTRWNFAFNFNV